MLSGEQVGGSESVDLALKKKVLFFCQIRISSGQILLSTCSPRGRLKMKVCANLCEKFRNMDYLWGQINFYLTDAT